MLDGNDALVAPAQIRRADKTFRSTKLLDELGRDWQSSGVGVVEVEPKGAD